MRESELFPPLKKHFKRLGYKVYAEVPVNYRGVDFVAVKGSEQISVEMKLHFNRGVVWQANQNTGSFPYSYVAYPVKKFTVFDDEQYWELRESTRLHVDHCMNWGIGILQVLPHGTIFKALEAKENKIQRPFDFSLYKERKDDEAGLPYQKGVSAGHYELKLIRAYIKKHPNTNWKEIYENVQNHYSSPQSLSGSMGQWRGFSLAEFKKSLI